MPDCVGGGADSGTRSSLMWNFVAIIERTQPKAVLWENVVGCLTDKMRPNYDKFFNALRSAGYKIHANILNSKDFGVPQNRERVFVLAIRKDVAIEFEYPIGYDCGIRLNDVLEKNVDEKYFLSDKQVSSLVAENERKKIKGMGFKLEPTDGKVISKTITSKTNRISNQFIKEPNLYQLSHGYHNGGFREVDNCLMKNGLVKKNDVIRHNYSNSREQSIQDGKSINAIENNMSPTLDTRCDCLGVCKDYRIRKLTPKECFRLMGFRDGDYNACEAAGISNAQLYKQAGNSIVVNVLMAIFGQLYDVEWKKKVYGDWYKSEQDLLAELPLLKGEIE